MQRLLLIGDDNRLLYRFVGLNSDTFELISTRSIAEGLESIRNKQPHAVFLDIDTTDCPDLTNLRKLCKQKDENTSVYVLSYSPDIETAVKAMKAGADDFINKKQDSTLFTARILNELGSYNSNPHKSMTESSIEAHHDRMVFTSGSMKKIYLEMNRLAHYSGDCLLVGETGVGKDLIASEIHKRSARREEPFVSVPVSSLSHTILESELFGHEKGSFSGADKRKIGKFEAAHGGTVYMPEISELSNDIQLKLLHFLQYKSINRVGQDARHNEIKVDARIIMATNERLDDLVKQGRIRKDFYYRISAVRIEIPPLRERPEDIEPLAHYFLERITAENFENKFTLDQKVIDAFRNYPWYGNVREMKNMIERALISLLFNTTTPQDSYVLTLDFFPELTKPASNKKTQANKQIEFQLERYKKAQDEFKKQYFDSLLRYTEGKISDAAKIAGITPQAIRKIISQLDIR